jgi:glycosyltransferase involved in cell wall biosynthesis
MTAVHVINPLGVALRHYEDELVATLASNGLSSRVVRFAEPSLADYGRAGWVFRAGKALFSARRQLKRDDVMVLIWPLLGFVDTIVVGIMFGRRGYVVFHDPDPLVRAMGYGRAVRFVAKRWSRAHLVVHSERAQEDLAALGFPSPVRLPHPVLPHGRSFVATAAHHVIVVGQFKPDRDVRAMEAIAAAGMHIDDLRVYGRGWPQVAGWTVESRFLDEAEFETRISEASVVLIPYRRFYQSGVAVRAIELGTPVVGPRRSSLDELIGTRPELLVDPDDVGDWIRAVEAACQLTVNDRRELLDDYVLRTHQAWSTAFDTTEA